MEQCAYWYTWAERCGFIKTLQCRLCKQWICQLHWYKHQNDKHLQELIGLTDQEMQELNEGLKKGNLQI